MRSRRSKFLLRPLTMWNIKAVGWATYEQRLRANMLGGCAVLLVPVEALRDRTAARPSMWHVGPEPRFRVVVLRYQYTHVTTAPPGPCVRVILVGLVVSVQLIETHEDIWIRRCPCRDVRSTPPGNRTLHPGAHESFLADDSRLATLVTSLPSTGTTLLILHWQRLLPIKSATRPLASCLFTCKTLASEKLGIRRRAARPSRVHCA
ncbi:hypothetical protein BD309DRAFT_194029 [Dichomitus squalens]|nr:hypothetical protein BD309DRAFT_194029 [Dichomitus squalens]